VRHRSRLRHCRRRLKHVPRLLSKSRGQPLQEHPCSCRASGARPAGPLTRPTESVRKTRREERPINRFQHLWEPQWQTHICSGATVGDSPRGPLKRQGNPRLRPTTKPKPKMPYLTMQDMARATKAPAAHQAAHSKTPSNRFRLARGCAPPSDGLRPDRGGAPPSSEVRLARGSAPPSNGVHLARGRPARAHLLPRTGIKCPDIGGTAPSCARGSRPGAAAPTPQEGAHPHHCGGVGLCGAAGASPVTPCTCSGTTNAPSPRRGTGCTLNLLSCDLTRLGGGARLVGRHPCHC
jgi:hypothetical protein